MVEKQKNKIREIWNNAFHDLERLKVNRYQNEFDDEDEVCSRFTPRKMAGLYAVASICYDEGNQYNVIENPVYDRLCKWLLKHYEECVNAGADLLDEEELRCCSGNDTTKFVKPYHDIAEMLLGHQCRCIKCTREQDASDVDRKRFGNPNLN